MTGKTAALELSQEIFKIMKDVAGELVTSPHVMGFILLGMGTGKYHYRRAWESSGLKERSVGGDSYWVFRHQS